MPQVPQYEPNSVARRGVATTARTGPGGDAFGGNVGTALARGGQALGGAADMTSKIIDLEAENEARRAAMEASTYTRETLWGDNGLMRKRGRAFLDSVAPTQKSLEEFQKGFGTRGRNLLERQMIDDAVRREIEPALGYVQRGHIKAVEDENRASATGRVTNVIDSGVAAFGDEDAFRRTLAQVQSATADEADAYGYDPETRQVKEREAFSRLYGAGILSLLDAGDPETAQRRYDQALVAGRLTAQTQNVLGERIRNAKNDVATATFETELAMSNGVVVVEGLEFGAPLAKLPEPSSTMGPRHDPFSGKMRDHTGIDYPAAEGDPVLATAPGKVVAVGDAGGYGTMVRVDHGDGIETWYAHLSEGSVKVGDIVKRGQRVGAVGSTGRSTGPHLHYEVRRDGKPTDPNAPSKAKQLELTYENLPMIASQRSGGDPKLYTQFMAAGQRAIARREAVKRERAEANLDAAWRALETATSVDAVPRSVWDALTPQQREGFRSHVKGNLAGNETDTDVGHYGDLMTLQVDNPRAFASYEFETDPKLSLSDKRSMIRERTELRAALRGGGEVKTSSLEATNRVANLTMPQRMNDAQQSMFKGALFRAVRTAEAQTGKPLDEKAIMDMASRLAVEVAGTPLYAMSPASAKKPGMTPWDVIPKADRDRLIADYRAKYGRTPTAGEVADQYVMLKASGRLK